MYNNPYSYNPYMQPMMSTSGLQNMQQPTMNTQNTMSNVIPTTQNRQVLNGKLVDSVEVAKNVEYPLDGSISYFPLTDGSAVVTKQLMQDGTSKITVYKPGIEKKEEIKYITQDDMKKALDGLNLDKLDDIEDSLNELKQDFKDFKKNNKKKED